MAAIIWLALGVVLAVAEAFSLSFVAIMVAAGAFAAAGAAALGAPVWLQGLVFALVTAATLAAVRPMIVRYQRSSAERADHEPMGVAALEGADAMVLESVDEHHGLVRIEGEEWTARSFDATQTFEPGERVQIIKIKGATALVWRMP
ncbi:NfeD family protein [Actinocatenispora thailandica]|uniref:NfeD family protein n=1 Tax=Actinocatenispora thailandica TaxID=227318 RepID=UPI0031DA1BD7